jgi:hypothetical protein
MYIWEPLERERENIYYIYYAKPSLYISQNWNLNSAVIIKPEILSSFYSWKTEVIHIGLLMQWWSGFHINWMDFLSMKSGYEM